MLPPSTGYPVDGGHMVFNNNNTLQRSYTTSRTRRHQSA